MSKLKLTLLLFSLFTVSFTAVAQMKVTGVVKDNTGETVIGATVREQGSSEGTVSDLDGNFAITVKSKSSVLEISYVGCKTQIIKVGDKISFDITLETDSKVIDEVVVMAYTSTVKRKVVASVTNVDMKQVESMGGYKDMGNALQGRVAGLIVTNSSGGPDSSPSISIRGGGDPMYVIDGIVQDKSAFMRLASQDIESMSVMKDAASSAVYGASAANGIIVVTTKKGKQGKMRINYTFDGQYNTPLTKRDKLNSLEYANIHNAISDYMGEAKPYSDIVLAKIGVANLLTIPTPTGGTLLSRRAHSHSVTP